ncbi:ATP-binding protein [Siminovitchia sp. FSL H7-0308]|uniref:sensor histidine kinase n=1 Tax=Siminovitchia sp. FSL H7-0308 TaxID=2921432 RepID=UPI00097D27F4|nr:ATP-binding protein [Bacillus sp. VT-16-64]
MMMIVPLAGEISFYPFNESFRISFGTPTFFFFLLLLRNIPAFLSGVIIGILVVAFRMTLGLLFFGDDVSGLFQFHYPTFFYYFTFGCFFQLLRVNHNHHSLLLGFLGIILEMLASTAELAFQYIAFSSTFTLADMWKVSIIAIFRSYFTVGFFNLMRLYQSRLREEEMRKQNEQLITLIATLYEESIHLSKTLINSENITKESYRLYQSLKNLKNNNNQPQIDPLCEKALKIAGETHEIKKDNQRIYIGLSKLISNKSFSEYMDIKELLNIAVKTNKKYAHSLGKNIEFLLDIQGSHPHYHIYKVLSIINNLIMNSIEIMTEAGIITICVYRLSDCVEIKIGDNGPGISPKRRDIIFKPGFTSKYDKNGIPSTGIGLTYVQELVERLEGKIMLQSKPEINGAIFTVRLPIQHLIQKG